MWFDLDCYTGRCRRSNHDIEKVINVRCLERSVIKGTYAGEVNYVLIKSRPKTSFSPNFLQVWYGIALSKTKFGLCRSATWYITL